MLGDGYIKDDGTGCWRKEALTVVSGAPNLKIVDRVSDYTAYEVTFKDVGDAVAWALDGEGIDTVTGKKRPVRLRFVLLACLTNGSSRDEQQDADQELWLDDLNTRAD
jgi:hypothetical protein